MALYPPIIDSSKAMQLISGENPANTVKVYYKSKNSDEMEAAYYLAFAINPRTGENILDSGEMALCEKKSDDDGKYIEVELDSENTIAQITLYAVKAGVPAPEEDEDIYDWYLDNKTKVSISSPAVIFKLFEDTINLVFPETSGVIDASPFRFTASVEFSNNSTDELAWYRIKLRSGSNILAQTDKCYPKSKNAIDEIINYDFNFKSIQTYQFDITIGTRNGIVREFTENENWSIDTSEIIITPNSNLGTVVINSTKPLITVTWAADGNNLFAADEYFASLYIQKGGFWRKVGLEVS